VRQTYYDVLEVTSSASDEEIKAAFRRLAKKYHPDVNRGREQEVKPLFLRAQKAFDVLSDPKRRAKYDKRIANGDAPELPTVFEVQPIDEFQISRSSLESSVVLPRYRRGLDPELRKALLIVVACIALAALVVLIL
jgi:curved DNA-binding protein CbpA